MPNAVEIVTLSYVRRTVLRIPECFRSFYRRGILWVSAPLAALLFLGADAERVATISLFGLSFRCPACEVTSQPECRVTFYHADKILGCREAFSNLLSEAAAEAELPAYPSVAELRRFLISERRSAETARPALQLLLKSEGGRQTLIQEGYAFAGPYSEVLASLVRDSAEQRPVWRSFWNLPSQEGVDVGVAFRAEIFATLHELKADDLFSDLTIVRPEQDIADLEVYETILEAKRPEIAAEIHQVRLILQECDVMHSAEARCGEASARLSPVAAKFVERSRLQRLTRAFSDGKLGVIDFIDRLKVVDQSKLRTPGLHGAIVKALASALDEQASDVRDRITTTAYRRLFEEVGKNDSIIANRWAALLCYRAGELFTAAKYDEAVELLEASYRVVETSLPERVEFLKKAADSPAWTSNPGLRKRFEEAVRRESAEKPWYALSPTAVTVAVLGIALFAGAWATYALRIRRAQIVEEQRGLSAELTAFAEREELQKLLLFFELSDTAGEAELTKSYRKKAKETHPDVSGRNSAQFNDLQEKFRRARELLLRRRSP